MVFKYLQCKEYRLFATQKFFSVTLLLLCIALQAASLGANSNSLSPDLIYHNGKILTVNSDFDIAEAVAIKGDRFVAVGDDKTVLALASPVTKVIDLDGRTVIPGLNDAHTHLPLAALAAAQLDDKYKVNLLDVADVQTALECIDKQVKQRPRGSWIVTSHPEVVRQVFLHSFTELFE